jgi:hypothetical protein
MGVGVSQIKKPVTFEVTGLKSRKKFKSFRVKKSTSPV